MKVARLSRYAVEHMRPTLTAIYAATLGIILQAGVAHAAPTMDEATAHAKSLFTAHRSFCSNATITALDVTAPGRPDLLPSTPTRAHTIYIEATAMAQILKGPGPNVSPADRMNGIEWIGAFTFASQTFREISVGKDGTRGAWTQWRNGTTLLTINLVSRNGKWETVETQPPGITALGRYAKIRRPSCADVPA